VLAIGVLAAGCIQPAVVSPHEVGDASEDTARLTTFVLRRGGPFPWILRVREDGLFGPDVSLGRFLEDSHIALRGRVGRDVVDLEIHPTRVLGLIGPTRVDLRVVRRDLDVFIDGLVRNQISIFELTPSGLHGNIGKCSYDLTSLDLGLAEGKSSCGVDITPTRLRLPDTLRNLSDAEKAAILAIFLS